MKSNILNLFNKTNLQNKILMKLWDEEKQKWYFEIVDVKKEEKEAIISYSELLNKQNK